MFCQVHSCDIIAPLKSLQQVHDDAATAQNELVCFMINITIETGGARPVLD